MTPADQQGDRNTEYPIGLHPGRRRDPDAGRTVGIHDHHGPVAALDLPLQGLDARPLGRRGPECLSPGGAVGAPPSVKRYVARNGDRSTLVKRANSTPSRYRSTSSWLPIPAKIGTSPRGIEGDPQRRQVPQVELPAGAGVDPEIDVLVDRSRR